MQQENQCVTEKESPVICKVSKEINTIELGFSDDSEVEFAISNKEILNSTVKTIIDSGIGSKAVEKEIIVSTPHKEHPEVVLPNPLATSHANANLDDIPGIRYGCDSGIASESSLEVIDTDEEDQESTTATVAKNTNLSPKKYKKPIRPCFFCKSFQSRLKRHILTKHKDEQSVKPLLKMNKIDQDKFIATFRKQAIRNHNLELLKSDRHDFLRERKSKRQNDELPLMCSGCKGFFAKSYKARHLLVCPASSVGVMLPVVSVEKCKLVEKQTHAFKELLNYLPLDEVGNYIKTDPIILMIGERLFKAHNKKKNKEIETRGFVRGRMRLTARLYLSFRNVYENQNEVKLNDGQNDASDMFRRELITVLDRAINMVTEKPPEELVDASVTNQKSGLKVNILNLIKLTSNLLMGYFLSKNEDARSQKVVDFLKVLKLYENEIFGDAYYDINYRKNVALRKPLRLPKDDDVRLLMEECYEILNTIDPYDYPSNSYVTVRSATATSLIIFCARRGGEPVRLQLYQWQEALNGEWVDQTDLPDEFNLETMYITYQTGKGSDHLVPVIFTPETVKGMQYLTNNEVRKSAGVHEKNPYVFASTHNSKSHASGWHSINDILERLSLKGAINATRNRHRVASLLAKLQLSEHEKNLIYKHFGHSKFINENVYQAAPGSLQLQTTGKRLMEINSSGVLKNPQDITQTKNEKLEMANVAISKNNGNSKQFKNQKYSEPKKIQCKNGEFN